jgi:hypothetical protein
MNANTNINKVTPTKKAKRTYQANEYTYNEVSPSVTRKNFTDFEKRKAYEEKMKMGGVGPERPGDYLKRYTQETERLDKAAGRIDGNQNKSRGTSSSSSRKLIK